MTPPGGAQLLVILVIVLLLFGSSRLPGLAKALGQSIAELRGSLGTSESEEDRDGQEP